jgi:hypothetical protein
METLDAAQLVYEDRQAAANQRFSASQSDLRYTQADKNASEAFDLVERQYFRPLNPLVFVERHAVGTPEVTAVRYGDAEIADRSVDRVLDVH